MYNPLKNAIGQYGVQSSPFVSKQAPMSLDAPEIYAGSSAFAPRNVQQRQINSAPPTQGGSKYQPTGDAYYDKLIKVESGGNPNAHNKGSGATGLGQFLPSTAKPILAKMGKTWGQYKADPALQMQVLKDFTNSNRQGLINSGIEPTSYNLWKAHNLGLGSVQAENSGRQVNPLYIRSNTNGGSTMADYDARWKNTWS